MIENDAQELRDQTRDAIRSARTGTDNELFKILRERFYGIPVTRRPTEAQILDSVVQYMNITGRMVPRDALMTLAQANWDFEFVVARHFDGAPAAPLPMLEPTVGGGPRSSSELSPPPEVRFFNGTRLTNIELICCCNRGRTSQESQRKSQTPTKIWPASILRLTESQP